MDSLRLIVRFLCIFPAPGIREYKQYVRPEWHAATCRNFGGTFRADKAGGLR
jgi:hypothetical protein